MFKIALITDVHANLEALKAVLSDIDRHKIADIISLGDNVGYGAEPVEVLTALHERDVFTIEGNHELAVVDPLEFSELADVASEALEWTRGQLWKKAKKEVDFETILGRYLDTPAFIILPDAPQVILVHGCPGNGRSRFNYLLDPQDLIEPSQYMKKRHLKICVFGHTHRQILWEVDNAGVSEIKFTSGEPVSFTDRELDGCCLFVNPGSVGQPRDQNPHAAYVIYEKKKNRHIFTFQRVPYNVKKTVNKIYAVRELDNSLGDRLTIGK